MNLKDIKLNENNPRYIQQDSFTKLINSVLEFPEMLSLRGIVIDETNTTLGGNMRIQTLNHIAGLGRDKVSELLAEKGKSGNLATFEPLFGGIVPDTWIKRAEGLTEEQKKEFVIKDNSNFGSWDWDMLANEWDENNLDDWGLVLPTDWDIPAVKVNEKEFEKEMDKVNDDNCQLPIVPDFFESHQCFIIPTHNTIDEQFIRDLFDTDKNHISNSGDGKERKTNVINIDKLKEWSAK